MLLNTFLFRLLNFCVLMAFYINPLVLTHLNRTELLSIKIDILLKLLVYFFYTIMYPLIFGLMLSSLRAISLIECLILFFNIKFLTPSYFLINHCICPSIMCL